MQSVIPDVVAVAHILIYVGQKTNLYEVNVSGYNLISGTKDWITFDEYVLCAADYFLIRHVTGGLE